MARRPSKHLRPPRPLDTSRHVSRRMTSAGPFLVREVPTDRAVKPYTCPGCNSPIPVGIDRAVIRQYDVEDRHRQKVDAEGKRAETQALFRRAPHRQPGQQPEQSLARHTEEHHEERPSQAADTNHPHGNTEERHAEEHGLKTVEPAGKNSDQTTHPTHDNGNTIPSEGQ